MIDGPAVSKIFKTAEKWRDLSEIRRDYFRELYRTGRWRLYYNEQEFVLRLRDIARLCDRWQMIVQTLQAANAEHSDPVETMMQRDAA